MLTNQAGFSGKKVPVVQASLGAPLLVFRMANLMALITTLTIWEKMNGRQVADFAWPCTSQASCLYKK